ncbi:MAG: hypothetical protein KJ666_08075 [Bacteroidetes bacterium]|nr:hypothetical protein [Bacteroidota bacterium]MBU2584192.1 hypothetical protein [Bacteroidota bacterium]
MKIPMGSIYCSKCGGKLT